MLWKDLKFGIRKYFIFVAIAAMGILFLGKVNDGYVNKQIEPINILLIQNDTLIEQLFSAYSEVFNLSYVNELEKGFELIETGKSQNIFVYYDAEDNEIKIIGNQSTSNEEIVKSYLDNVISPIDYKFVLVQNQINRLKELLSTFNFLISFVCFWVPFKMFSDEKNTITFLASSPIKNQDIVLSKAICTLGLFSFGVLFFYMVKSVSIREISILYLYGMLYICLGLFMGVFSDNKTTSYVFYPLIMCIMLFPTLFSSTFEKVGKIFDAVVSDTTYFFIGSTILLFIIFVMLKGVIYAFSIKLRRQRI